MSDQGQSVRFLMLRHGRVAHHRGDVPLTDMGTAQAEAAGKWFASEGIEIAGLLSGETLRTRDTAEKFAAAYRGASGVALPDPAVSFGLRNPDLYLGGQRINLGEWAEFLASQAPGVDPAAVETSVFYGGLMAAKDRVGHWLEHGNVPGENAHDVGRRVDVLIRSLVDVEAWRGKTVVGISHSPVMRAVRFNHWGEYSKEPPFLHGYSLTVHESGAIDFALFETDLGDVPTTNRPGEGNEKK